MFWKTDLGKILILAMIGIAVMVPSYIFLAIRKSQPTQTVHVEVIETRKFQRVHNRSVWYVTFKYPDGTEKEWDVPSRVYQDVQAGDTGTLTYSTWKKHFTFVDFVKDS